MPSGLIAGPSFAPGAGASNHGPTRTGTPGCAIPVVSLPHVALRSARRRILVAESTKLGAVAFVTVRPLDTIDILITDSHWTTAPLQCTEMGLISYGFPPL